MEGSPVQVVRDKVIYRASSLGMCSKALVALRLGYEPMPIPEGLLTTFAEGHLHESAVLDLMEKEGWKIYDRQKEVRVKVSDRISVVGHIDGKGYKFGRGHVVEVKSQSADAWEDFEVKLWNSGLFPKYKWQVSVYMLAEGMGLALVRKNRNTGRVKTSYHYEPFYSVGDIRRRVLAIEAMALSGTLPDSCDSMDYPCPVFYLHEDDEREQLEDPELDVLALQYVEAGRDERVAKEKRARVRKAIEEGLGEVQKATTKLGTKITFYYAKNAPVFSEKKMKDDGLDPDKYKTQGESKRLKVTLPKEDDDDDREVGRRTAEPGARGD